jgi:hypothetical protein
MKSILPYSGRDFEEVVMGQSIGTHSGEGVRAGSCYGCIRLSLWSTMP